MKEIQSKSILLTQILLVIFAVILLLADVFMIPFARWFFGARIPDAGGAGFTVIIVVMYLCTAVGWVFIFCMWQLLTNIKRGDVFVEENVKLMTVVSFLMLLAALLTVAGSFFYLPFLFVSISALFVALIVRIVKTVFQQAIAMKSELDLTI